MFKLFANSMSYQSVCGVNILWVAKIAIELQSQAFNCHDNEQRWKTAAATAVVGNWYYWIKWPAHLFCWYISAHCLNLFIDQRKWWCSSGGCFQWPSHTILINNGVSLCNDTSMAAVHDYGKRQQPVHFLLKNWK